MPHVTPLDYAQAPAESQAVFDEIMALRGVEDVNNFWKYLANHPAVLRRTWDSLKSVMTDGALDPLTKEMIYLAISMSNGCDYCVQSHTAQARAKGMSEQMLGELIAVVGMANETNALVAAYQVELDKSLTD